MRKIRAVRGNRYSYNGFIRAETQFLKQIPLQAPYSVMMRRERLRLYKQAIGEAWTDTKYAQAIAHLYEVRGWRVKGQDFDKSAVFAMVRDYERQWHDSASPDDLQRWISPSAKKSHHSSDINRQRVLAQKRLYNSQPSVMAKRAEYRRKNRAKIAEAERKRRAFQRTQGVAGA